MTPTKSQAVTDEAVKGLIDATDRLSEAVTSDIKKLADATTHLSETVASVDKNLALNAQMLASVKERVEGHEKDITEQCKRIDGQDLAISKLGGRTDDIESWKRTVNAIGISVFTAVAIVVVLAVLGLAFGVVK